MRKHFIAPVMCLAAFCRVALAEQVIAPAQPQISTTPPALRDVPNEMQVFDPADTWETFFGALGRVQLFQWGPVTLHPHLNYRFLYGNGIQSSPGNQQATIVQTFSPGMLFVIGKHWTLDYTPTWTFYSSKAFSDSLNHSVSLSWGTAYEDWVFGFSQGYSRSSAPLTETATQTDTETYSTSVNASYRFNDKMSTDLGINQNFNLTQQFSSSRQWSTMDWLNYDFWTRLQVSAGVGGGYVDVDSGPNQTYEQFQARVNWRATDKTSISVHGGFEDRQFLSGGADDAVNPIFGVAVQYQPFEFTQISLNADRAVSTSYLQNQVTETTTLNINLTQRLFEKYSLSLGGGYHTTEYIGSTTGTSTGRTDDSYSFSARLSRAVFKHGTVAATYTFTDNSSSQSGFSYSSSQVGFEVGIRY